MDLEPAVGFEDGAAGTNVGFPGCHAGDQETAVDEVHATWSDMWVLGSEEVMVVSVNKSHVIWLFGVWRDGCKINAVDLSRGKLATEMVGDGTGATAHVEDADRIFDRRVEDFA